MSLLPSSSILHNASCVRPEASTGGEESTVSRSPSRLTSEWLDRRQYRSSHSVRPRPGRRRENNHLGSQARTTPLLVRLLLSVLLILSTACTTCEAAHRDLYFRKSEFAKYARRGEILIDRRPSPQPRVYGDLYRRQEGDPFGASSTTSHSFSTTISIPVITTKSIHSTVTVPYSGVTTPPASSSDLSASPSSTTSEAIAAASTTPLPRPFDSSLGSNFTSSTCPDFFKSFLSNSTFNSCLPFSLLLQNSASFFHASNSLTLISRTLDATCAAPYSTCLALTSTLAAQLRDKDNCGADYLAQNPVVLQAYAGLVAYAPLYTASCLKDEATGEYCYAEAITNTTQPADSYAYFLPLGVPLPQGTELTCSGCLQNTMAIFNEAARNMSQPVSGDYVSAAGQINANCGSGFVNSSVQVIAGSGRNTGSSLLPPIGIWSLLGLAVFAGLF